jgi:hypothetical protein
MASTCLDAPRADGDDRAAFGYNARLEKKSVAATAPIGLRRAR